MSLWSKLREVLFKSGASTENIKIVQIPSIQQVVSRSIEDAVRLVPFDKEKVTSRGLTYYASFSKPEWVTPAYNHVEIERIFDIEAYFARAVSKKLALFLREGGELIGNNDLRIKYVKMRLDQISRASGLPFPLLLLRTCRDLEVHANAYWLKVRKRDSSGGFPRKINGTTIEPIAGVFPLCPESVEPKVDRFGNIVAWRQLIGEEEKVYHPRDIQHFVLNQKAGYPLGVPKIVPLIDDIRVLRIIETNVNILIDKHLFPIILWRIGNDNDPVHEYADGITELEVFQTKIEGVPMEGSLVVPHRYDAKVLGVESQALDVMPYLEYFRERILAGLDISTIDVGLGSSASRSTANKLSQNLIDVVQFDQLVISNYFQYFINELLLESSFPKSSLFQGDNIVSWKFHEIDKDSKIQEFNHYIDSFLKNSITYPELRKKLGEEPLTPEEEKELYWNKFGKEIALITPIPIKSAGGNSISTKNNPTNQNGNRGGPKISKDILEDRVSSDWNLNESDPITPLFDDLVRVLQDLYAQDGWNAFPDMRSKVISSMGKAIDLFTNSLIRSVSSKYKDPLFISSIRFFAENYSAKTIGKLQTDILERLRLRRFTPQDLLSPLRFRGKFIFETETARIMNLSTFQWLQQDWERIRIHTGENCCDECKSLTKQLKQGNIAVGLPPYHPLCECRVVIKG